MNKGIQNIFSPIPQTYELINHILTLGFDTPIRRYTARFAASSNAQRILDVCTGTGEMAHYLSKYVHPVRKTRKMIYDAKDNLTTNKELSNGAEADTLVMASDFTLPMLRYARQGRNSPVRFTAADSIRLPFRDNTFDLLTISFATRNINISYQNLLACLKEFRRVLKPGGRFINLETSQPSSIALRKLLHSFVRIFVRPIGSAISGSPSAYAYLSQTIPLFYDADRFSEIILEAGFKECKYKRLLGGLAAIHQGKKILATKTLSH